MIEPFRFPVLALHNPSPSLRNRCLFPVQPNSREFDVAVVGAGLSGLVCAHMLVDAGLDTVVLEGGDRVGGRIHSVRDGDGNHLADLGPTWVWPPYQPVVAHWLERLNLATFAQFNQGPAVIEGFGGGLRRQPLPGQHGMVRLEGGPQMLIDTLKGRIPSGSILLNSRVLRVKAEGGGMQLRLASGPDVMARHVVLATPLRASEARIDIPELDAGMQALMRATPTWMAVQAKATVLYETPFWRKEGLAGRIASQTGPMVEVHDHSPSDAAFGALFGFVGWPPEMRMAEPDALRSAILEQLVRSFGPAAETPLQITIEDWAENDLICSPQDLETVPQHPEPGPDLMRQPHVQGRLWFAVSETSALSPGLIEGALNAGQTTAEKILAATG
ncbi:MAG: FAD-dependent oxidoreductase [Paracoccaceae bacterium]